MLFLAKILLAQPFCVRALDFSRSSLLANNERVKIWEEVEWSYKMIKKEESRPLSHSTFDPRASGLISEKVMT